MLIQDFDTGENFDKTLSTQFNIKGSQRLIDQYQIDSNKKIKKKLKVTMIKFNHEKLTPALSLGIIKSLKWTTMSGFKNLLSNLRFNLTKRKKDYRTRYTMLLPLPPPKNIQPQLVACQFYWFLV